MDLKSEYQDPGKIILIDKPLRWTSFDVVKKIRNTIKIKKVGHAGTLDPLATGLLILCTGKKTKQIEGIQGQEKEYIFTLVLGKTTPSYDLETPIEDAGSIAHITEGDVQSAAKHFEGEQDQVPPVYSAIKVQGERAYKFARAGEDIKLKSRKITIHHLEVTGINFPDISMKVICTKGTYIRSLVRDIGKYLKTEAYLKELRRTRIGEFDVKEAVGVEEFKRAYENS
ncbi:MAG: tRNA pseudouridine(55) synthase TruB [Candidatus Cyclobacteriaceae bacterium M2_1C_046]